MSKTKGSGNDSMNAILANIEKQMGNKGRPVFSRFGNIEIEKTPVISFGIPALDEASGCGGIPRGKMVEIYGPESSGKSLLTLYLIASAQKQGLECVLLDIENSFEASWAEGKGVDIKKLIYANDFTSGEQALEYAYKFCLSGSVGLVVIDSTAALLPLSEIEGRLDENARIGEQARMMSRGCRKIIDACAKGNTSCVFINQTRSKIGVMYGSPETTPGGAALRFYSHQRIRTTPKEKIKVKEGNNEKVVGQISTATFIKNKTAPPNGKAEFSIIYNSASLNPVVMLCNSLRAVGIIGVRNGILRIGKDKLDNSKPIDTGATTIMELADYLIDNKMVLPLLDKLIEARDEDDTNSISIDDSVLEMKEDNSLIVSPKNSVGAKIEIKKVDNASSAEVGDDSIDNDIAPDDTI